MKPNLHPSILIVDENRLYGRAIGHILEERGDAHIHYAINEPDLFNVLGYLQPDLIIFDIYSLSTSYKEFLKSVQFRSDNSKLIVMSFETQEEVVHAFMQEGVSGFFDKAICDELLLVENVKKVLDGETVILNGHTVTH